MADETSNDGPCRRTDDGLVICKPLLMAFSDTSLGIQDWTAINFKTGAMVRYIGVRPSRKAKPLLFNCCPFCRFEYAVKPKATTGEGGR